MSKKKIMQKITNHYNKFPMRYTIMGKITKNKKHYQKMQTHLKIITIKIQWYQKNQMKFKWEKNELPFWASVSVIVHIWVLDSSIFWFFLFIFVLLELVDIVYWLFWFLIFFVYFVLRIESNILIFCYLLVFCLCYARLERWLARIIYDLLSRACSLPCNLPLTLMFRLPLPLPLPCNNVLLSKAVQIDLRVTSWVNLDCFPGTLVPGWNFFGST